MILICWDEISAGLVGTDFTLRLHGKSNFIPTRKDSFPPLFVQICLNVLLMFLCKHVLNYCFIPLRQVEKVTWENFIQTKRDTSGIKEKPQSKNQKQSKEHVLRRLNPYLHLLFKFFPLPNTRINIIPLMLKKVCR